MEEESGAEGLGQPMPPDVVLRPTVAMVIGVGLLSGVFVVGAVAVALSHPHNGGTWAYVVILGVLLPALQVRGVLVERFEIHNGLVSVSGFGPRLSFNYRGILAVHRSGGRYRPAHFDVTPEVGRLIGRRRRYRTRMSVPSYISTTKIARALGMETVPYGPSLWLGTKFVKSYHAPPGGWAPPERSAETAPPVAPAGPPPSPAPPVSYAPPAGDEI